MDWANCNFADIKSTLSAVNVSENESVFRIEVAAQGMRNEDFKVSIENGRLVVTSERKDEKKDEKKASTAIRNLDMNRSRDRLQFLRIL